MPNEGFIPKRHRNWLGEQSSLPFGLPMQTAPFRQQPLLQNPLDDVPGVREGSCGFSVAFSACTANSAVTVFPATKPPANCNESTTLALLPGVKPSQIGDPICVGNDLVLKYL